jgi:hypothetical protein
VRPKAEPVCQDVRSYDDDWLPSQRGERRTHVRHIFDETRGVLTPWTKGSKIWQTVGEEERAVKELRSIQMSIKQLKRAQARGRHLKRKVKKVQVTEKELVALLKAR